LFCAELAYLLSELKESYEDWTKNTPERYSFDLLVRRTGVALIDYLEDILMIIGANVESSKEIELRMDMLALVEFLIQ
jgi:hypothetical protein